MTTESSIRSLPRNKDAFWTSPGSLHKRLTYALADYAVDEFHITTYDLASNASFVNYVRHHRLTHFTSGATLDVIEKSIRKILCITSQESRFHRERDVLANSLHFKHPACLCVIETPFESLIFTQYVQGQIPQLATMAGRMALGIAEIETLSSQHVQNATRHNVHKFWTMDFFRLWYLVRPRFNFKRGLHSLEELASVDPRFCGLTPRLRAMVPLVHRAAGEAKRSPRCFCHMDYLRKNFFVSDQGLHMIDWSEFKIGRIGFDGGAYLSALFRRSEMQVFLRARDEFLKAYVGALDSRFDVQGALHNVNYFFLQDSLWHFLRENTIAEYRQLGKLNLLRKKYDYLLRPATGGPLTPNSFDERTH